MQQPNGHLPSLHSSFSSFEKGCATQAAAAAEDVNLTMNTTSVVLAERPLNLWREWSKMRTSVSLAQRAADWLWKLVLSRKGGEDVAVEATERREYGLRNSGAAWQSGEKKGEKSCERTKREIGNIGHLLRKDK